MKLFLTAFFISFSINSLAMETTLKIVNAHFSRESIVVQIQDTTSGSTKWFSTSTVGVINSDMDCNGDNCKAFNLKVIDNGLYGDASILNQYDLSLTDTYLVSFYESTLIDPQSLTLSIRDGQYIVSIIVK